MKKEFKTYKQLEKYFSICKNNSNQTIWISKKSIYNRRHSMVKNIYPCPKKSPMYSIAEFHFLTPRSLSCGD